jgi:hypothetical protein
MCLALAASGTLVVSVLVVSSEGPELFHLAFIAPFLSDAYSREVMNQSKYIQEPEHHTDDYDGIQDRLDAARHGDEAIHQPQQNANYDQNRYKLN